MAGSDEPDDGPNRRTFLSALGAATGGVALGGFGSVSVAASDAATEQQVEEALSSDRVRTIFDELGEVPVDADDAEHVVLSDENRQYEVVRFATTVGTLSYVSDDAGTEEAMLRIGDSDGVGEVAAQHLPETYQGLPADVEAMYLAGEGGDALFRSPTAAERNALAAKVDADPEDMYAFAYGESPGFQVLLPGADDELTAYSVQPSGAITTDAVYGEVGTGSISAGDVTEQNWGLAKCGSICLTCVTAAATCVRCAIPCAGSVTGIGAIACAVCLVASCSAGAGGCYLCYDNCRHHL